MLAIVIIATVCMWLMEPDGFCFYNDFCLILFSVRINTFQHCGTLLCFMYCGMVWLQSTFLCFYLLCTVFLLCCKALLGTFQAIVKGKINKFDLIWFIINISTVVILGYLPNRIVRQEWARCFHFSVWRKPNWGPVFLQHHGHSTARPANTTSIATHGSISPYDSASGSSVGGTSSEGAQLGHTMYATVEIKVALSVEPRCNPKPRVSEGEFISETYGYL